MKPIEYIGSQPRKQKARNFFGGWVILLAAIGTAVFFGMKLSETVLAAGNVVSDENVVLTTEELALSGSRGDLIAIAALKRTLADVTYDESYHSIDYPGGDIPAQLGRESDVIVRSFREVGLDLQKAVHEDMKENFRLYPQIYGAAGPDHNTDHRRVPNLQRWFNRNATELGKSRDAADYEYGDVVAWFLSSRKTHIGIVVPGPGDLSHEKWVVHNIGAGPVWDDALFKHQVIGHYRLEE